MLSAIAFGIAALLFVAVVVVMERHRSAGFNERFPPISDDEFMTRCPARTNPVVAIRVRRIISDQLGVEYERIYPESSFVGDLDAW